MKMKYIMTCIVITAFAPGCLWNSVDAGRQKAVYRIRGLDCAGRLKPHIYNTGQRIFDLYSVPRKNCLGTVNGRGEFAYLEFGPHGPVGMKPVRSGFPPYPGQHYCSDGEHEVLWMIRGRGFYAIDTRTLAVGHTITSGNGNDWILNVFLADPERKIFLIEMARPFPRPHYLIHYSLAEDRTTFTSPSYKGACYPFYDRSVLLCEFTGKNNSVLRWQIADLRLERRQQNRLTEVLNRHQIRIFDKYSLQLGKRMILGARLTGTGVRYFSIRWNEDISAVTCEQLTYPQNDRFYLDDRFMFSRDGNWVRSRLIPKAGRDDTGIELIMYHVNDGYPNGLSQPVSCGYSGKDTLGAFMEHESWGTCYVELAYGLLHVFILEQGLDANRRNAVKVQ